MTAKEAIETAMYQATELPCGGIGPDGPSLEELREYVNQNGKPMEDDAVYQSGQEIYRLLEIALKEMEGNP